MKHILGLVALVLAACYWGAIAQGEESDATLSSAEAERFFESRVRPLLSARCQECHGEKKQEAGLRLDSRAAILAGSDSGPVVKPGQPDASPLVTAVRYGGDVEMPPTGKLAAAEIDALAAWVKLGLPWPQSAATSKADPGMEERFRSARSSHWAYQPIRRPPLPKVSDAHWGMTPVDRFILARLERAELHPSPAADRYTLIRRATYDLWGLPPTYEQVEAFVHDAAPDAYERLIDRLLASPRYGERWGRHWLDVARYADTKGYAFQQELNFPYAYTYRDWVIEALNRDLPYDQFVLAQLAADLVPHGEDNRSLAALGLLTVGRKFRDSADNLDDQIDTVTRGLLGMTVACARCHDHKYDPIPTEDYYSLYGIFASSYEPAIRPLLGNPHDTPGYEEFQAEYEKRLATLAKFEQDKHAQMQPAVRKQTPDYLARIAAEGNEKLLDKLPYLSLDPQDLKPQIVVAWRNYLKDVATAEHPVWGPWHDLLHLADEQFSQLAPTVLARWEAMPEGTRSGTINPWLKSALAKEPPVTRLDVPRLYGQVLVAATNEKSTGGKDASSERSSLEEARQQLRDILLSKQSPAWIPPDDIREYLPRADRNMHRQLEAKIDEHESRSPGAPPRAMLVVDRPQPVEPHVFIRGNPTRLGPVVPRQFLRILAGDHRQPFTKGSGRLELARAIVAPDNPLTARVIVNRLWMHHFGEPLVPSASDFGSRSDPPTHPELLDYLARELIDQGWSLKHLHRLIILSATYQQASSHRADAAAKDPENRLWWRANRRRLEFEPLRDSLIAAGSGLDLAIGGRPIDITAMPASRRRAVYGLVDRQDLPQLFRAFDFASPDQSSPARPRTTVPQQALFLMNSPMVLEQAKQLAALPEVANAADNRVKIAALYRLVLAREPAEDELTLWLAHLATEDRPSNRGLALWEQYAQLLLMSNEFVFVD